MKDLRSGPPCENPTRPFWQSPPNARIANYRSWSIFPHDVDIVIIGSGLTGALIAYNLLSCAGPKPSILMLEARTAASGATGGHIKPDCCRGFDEYAEHHGVETALEQCHFEAANLEAMVDFIQKNNLEEEVDLILCDTVDTYMSASKWDWGFTSYKNFKKAGGNVSKIKVYVGDEAKQVTRVPGCFGAISYPAASLWPYKLTIAVLSMALDLGLNLQTHTPVKAVEHDSSGNLRVVTEKAEIKTLKVIHATNGYCSYLLPDLTGRLVPLKGHVAAITPSTEYEAMPLEKTMAFIWDADYDYLIQRKAKGKHLILGGRDSAHSDGSIGPLGDSDDSIVNNNFASRLKIFPRDNFDGWEPPMSEAEKCDPKASSKTLVWTGIMGITNDSLPFLGELPGKKGQYIAAGYNGHGMARIFLSVKAFCQFFHGEEIDSRVPSVYFDLERRLKDPIDLVKMGWVS